MKLIRNLLVRHPISGFFLLAYSISWALWLPPVWAHVQRDAGRKEGAFFFFLGNFGPFLAALITSGAVAGRAGLSALLERLLPWQAPFRWYLTALYGFPALGLLTFLLLGLASPQDVWTRSQIALIRVPLYSFTTFLVLGPLGEELGWRGFALPRLATGRTALSASVILGIMWAVWHAPLMLFPEWRADLPLATFVILYVLYIIPLAIIFTWVYNQANGSVLVAMVLHASFNYTLFFLDNTFGFGQHDPLLVQVVIDGVFWLVAGALIAVYGSALSSRG